ncbi:MAG: hypothetical protein M3362_25830 [Acidobacteriota bacterium]|nr:hypothetical protein [Acidobacteriota bacterium]
MSYIFRIIKRLFFWGYARNTWQYDVLCAAILAFIFLTPRSWFDSGTAMKNWSDGEPVGDSLHQKTSAQKLIITAADGAQAQMNQNEIEGRLRIITGRPDIEVLNVRPVLDRSGKVVAFEVDIR